MNDKVQDLRRNSIEAQNYFTKILAYTIGPIELKNLMDEDEINLIDVRRSEDFQIAHIPGAISIPKDEIENNFNKISKEKVNVVYCYNQQCHLGATAALILAEYSYPVVLLEGGFQVWTEDFRFATVS